MERRECFRRRVSFSREISLRLTPDLLSLDLGGHNSMVDHVRSIHGVDRGHPVID